MLPGVIQDNHTNTGRGYAGTAPHSITKRNTILSPPVKCILVKGEGQNCGEASKGGENGNASTKRGSMFFQAAIAIAEFLNIHNLVCPSS